MNAPTSAEPPSTDLPRLVIPVPPNFTEAFGKRLLGWQAAGVAIIAVVSGLWQYADSFLDEVQSEITRPLAGFSYVGPAHSTVAPTGAPTAAPPRLEDAINDGLPNALTPNGLQKVADSQCGPRTILQYEVINPGPGALDNIKLVINVGGTYDKITGNFSNGLISCDRGGAKVTMAEGVSVHAPSIEVTPISGTRLDPGKRFLISLDVPIENWRPTSALVFLDGNHHSDANAPLPDLDDVLKSRVFYDQIRLWLSILAIVVISATVAFVLHFNSRRVRRFYDDWAKKLPEWEKQIRADEAVRVQSTLVKTRDLSSGLPKALVAPDTSIHRS